MHVPLLGTLVIAVFKKMKSLPESKIRLYEIFVELMCGGWDLAKNVRRDTRFGSQPKLGVLIRLAGLLHNEHRREAREEHVREAVRQTAAGFEGQWRNLLDEILEDGLLSRMGSHGLAFSHLSFQEYLAATELTDPNGTRQQRILKLFLSGEDWWREVLAFYVATSKRPDETEGWIRRTVMETPKTARVMDLRSRFDFLISALASAWPAWAPNNTPPV
jgi:predicted NACHT family NTPase